MHDDRLEQMEEFGSISKMFTKVGKMCDSGQYLLQRIYIS